MAISVLLFNASSLVISVTVNQGPQIAVPPTGVGLNWAPQRQNPSNGPAYTPGLPAPNAIGNTGTNILTALIDGVPVGGSPLEFTVPPDYPVGSLQIYLLFASIQNGSWLVLADGKPIEQRIQMQLA